MVLCETTRGWCGVKKIQEDREATKQCEQGQQERAEKWPVECKQLPPTPENHGIVGEGRSVTLAIKREEDRRGHRIIWVTVAFDYIALIDFSF